MTYNLQKRITLVNRIRRGLRALNTQRISGETFDMLLIRWGREEKETSL